MEILADAGNTPASGVAEYIENLRVPEMSLGTYFIPAGGDDLQQPHTEDEVYIVLRGRATLWTPEMTAPATAGSVMFVPAGEAHRFVDIAEDLTVLVVFAPAEHSRPAPA
jgi:mannose-6-phosphate isomerase-like protein (cupin superfamily)